MADFLNNIFTFPTLFFTGLLGLMLLYWLISMMGFIDFDFGGDGLDFDIDASDAPSSGWLSKLKLDGIPVTISLSLIILFSWIICFLLVHFYRGEISEIKQGWIETVIGFWIIILAPVLSALITGALLTPFKPIFKKMGKQAEGRKASSLVGHIAKLRTNKVTMDFGDAEIENEGASLILKVRAEEPNEMKRGDKILITKYIAEQNIYKVRPKY